MLASSLKLLLTNWLWIELIEKKDYCNEIFMNEMLYFNWIWASSWGFEMEGFIYKVLISRIWKKVMKQNMFVYVTRITYLLSSTFYVFKSDMWSTIEKTTALLTFSLLRVTYLFLREILKHENNWFLCCFFRYFISERTLSLFLLK